MNSFSEEQRLNMAMLATDTKQFAKHIRSMEVMETDYFVSVNTHLPSYNFNIITLMKPFQKDMVPALQQQINFMNDQDLPFNLWCFAEDLAAVQFLQANHLQLYPETYVAMNVEVRSLRLRSLGELMDELVLQRVKTTKQLGHFSEVIQTIYTDTIERQAIKTYYECVGEVDDFTKTNTELFVGYYKGQPVATGAFTVKETTAGIYHMATKKQFRGHGFATTMMNFLLKKLRDQGVTHMTLQSSKAGKGIYKSFGFQAVGELKAFENTHLINYEN